MPSRNDGVTMDCPVCGTPFEPAGRQRWCSPACRQAAYRRRHNTIAQPPLPPSQHQREATVYECDTCGTRQLGDQRCPDCGLFGRRIGYGAMCPHCDEPVAIDDLIERT